jgi:molybdopterin molybdotransferase
VLTELGLTLRFWRVRIRPGAPLAFGRLEGTPWLGLPGNPVSAMVTFELFARPAIRKMLGHTALFRRPIPARVAETITISAPLTHFLRAELRMERDGYVATLTGPQGSGLLSSMVKADALLIIPPERPRIEAGEIVEALLLRDDALHTSTIAI